MNENINDIKEKLKLLPLCPGVYIMKDKNDNVIYVGKSKLLKNRVSQYFMKLKNHSAKTLAMISNVYDFDYYVTDTETEALVLECNLIKKFRPKYNILLKDDKQYPYIKITFNEEFPRIYMTRKIIKDGSKYFGPFMSSYMVRETLETIKRIFKVRGCNKNLSKNIGKDRPCLYFHLKQCSAPCAGKISAGEYRENLDKIAEILEGKYDGVVNYLTKEMNAAVEALEFEHAARCRDKIYAVKMLGEKQKIISTTDNNRDIIGIYQDERSSCIQIFYMRDGKTSGSEYYVFEEENINKEELLSEFLKQYYFNVTIIPKEILIPYEIDDLDNIMEWLSQKTGHKISLKMPRRGEKLSMVEMVSRNAEESLQKYRLKRDREETDSNEILFKLMNLLGLKNVPYRIECYDISNISGTQNIGACVVYNKAHKSKKDYRRFKIKTIDGANDYESMREMIYRRIMNAYKEQDQIKSGAMEENKAKFLPLPDLILVDGGKGHVSSVKLLMNTLGEDIPVFGLVKDDKHRTRGITDDLHEYELGKDESLFKFLSCVQDEVHRFAITGFRKKHEEESIHSELENIPGIGPVKRKMLLNYFGSVENIRNADIEKLKSIVGETAALNTIEYFVGGDNID